MNRQNTNNHFKNKEAHKNTDLSQEDSTTKIIGNKVPGKSLLRKSHTAVEGKENGNRQ